MEEMQAKEQETETTEEAPKEPHGTEGVTTEDYEKLLANSRKWEKRAKENAKAAEELEKLRRDKMSDLERLQLERDEAVQRATQLMAEREHAEMIKEAEEQTGMSAAALSVISAASLEELVERANVIKESFKQTSLPQIAQEGKRPQTLPQAGSASDWLRAQFNK
jgi:hypothetical protein